MRTLRTAFVVTVTAAACNRNAPPTVEEPHRNPPANPEPVPTPNINPPAPTCPPRESIHEGDACPSPGLECYQPTGGCQPGGFRCESGRWQATPVPTCNPPPPPELQAPTEPPRPTRNPPAVRR